MYFCKSNIIYVITRQKKSEVSLSKQSELDHLIPSQDLPINTNELNQEFENDLAAFFSMNNIQLNHELQADENKSNETSLIEDIQNGYVNYDYDDEDELGETSSLHDDHHSSFEYNDDDDDAELKSNTCDDQLEDGFDDDIDSDNLINKDKFENAIGLDSE